MQLVNVAVDEQFYDPEFEIRDFFGFAEIPDFRDIFLDISYV